MIGAENALIKALEAEIYRPINLAAGEKISDRAEYRNGLRFALALARAQAAGVSKELLAVRQEIHKATSKFPTWPTDPLHALAVLGEEFGELTKATLQHIYEPHKSTADDVRTEAIQTAAMALRFLMSLDAYQYKKGAQHEQASTEFNAGEELKMESLCLQKNK